MEKNINITLRIWRQKGPKEKGAFKEYSLQNISTESSFLEMLDVLNEQLINNGEDPSFSTTTAAKASAVCARSTSTDTPTGPTKM